jgi:hypothetical protein
LIILIKRLLTERNEANLILDEAKFFGIAELLLKISTKSKTNSARCSQSREHLTSPLLSR